MGVNGRTKGAGFERVIAKLVVERFAEHGITNLDCYRTPLSGGHFAASKVDPGDLLISPALRKLFPYSVEAKFYKELQWRVILSDKPIKGNLETWWIQCCKAASKTELIPMLVFKQNQGAIYAMLHVREATHSSFKPSVSVHINVGQDRVRIVLFSEILAFVG